MIPVFRPSPVSENAKMYVLECLESNWLSGSGPFVQRFEEAFAKYHGKKYGIAVSSGTAALETALWAEGMRWSDEVIIPEATIISNLLAVLRNFGKANCVDVNSHGELVPTEVKKRIVKETKFIMPVHLFGMVGQRKELWDLAQEYRLKFIEDCSQTWISPLGTGCYSLFINKFVTCGEGGIILTDDATVAQNARRYRDLCHSGERFVHSGIGYNFRMSNLQAAVALASLENVDKELSRRRLIVDLYSHYLPAPYAIINRHSSCPWMPLVSGAASRIVPNLEKQGIEARRFYYPLSLQPLMVSKERWERPVTALSLWRGWFYLPCTDRVEEVKIVCKALGDMQSTMI